MLFLPLDAQQSYFYPRIWDFLNIFTQQIKHCQRHNAFSLLANYFWLAKIKNKKVIVKKPAWSLNILSFKYCRLIFMIIDQFYKEFNLVFLLFFSHIYYISISPFYCLVTAVSIHNHDYVVCICFAVNK